MSERMQICACSRAACAPSCACKRVHENMLSAARAVRRTSSSLRLVTAMVYFVNSAAWTKGWSSGSACATVAPGRIA
eukprot:4855058-Pleurochrysis_carterae.AAC.2